MAKKTKKEKKYETIIEEQERKVRHGLQNIKNGNSSESFKRFLDRWGLDLPRPKETGNIVQDIQNNIVWMEERKKWLETIVDYYKSTHARGLTILDDVIQLDVDIMRRERKLQEEGIDPLEDEALQKAKKRKFEMMQYLDKIKFEKDKFYVEQKVRDMRKSPANDSLFVVEADYETDERYEKAKEGEKNE